jgi:alpha-tubulin suppressor-like RCC1 family protein
MKLRGALVLSIVATAACGHVVTATAADATSVDATSVDATSIDEGAPDGVVEEAAPVCPAQCPAGRPTCLRGACVGVMQVAAGGFHTCALLSDTTLWCWGLNDHGQLGDGTMTSRPTPAPVPGLRGVAGVAAGYVGTCAWMLDGSASCWGLDLQATNSIGGARRLTPTAMGGLTGVVAISLRTLVAAAVLRDGTLRAWGDNRGGLLGLGHAGAAPSAPVAVPGLRDVTQVSVADFHTCVRDARGLAACWGFNFGGAIGDGTTVGAETPVAVASLRDVEQVAAGGAHSCARLRDGSVWCWGGNTNGELGDGTTTRRTVPTRVVTLDGVTQISAGLHTCAVLADTSVRCWGFRDFSTPSAITGLTGVAEVSTSTVHTCARLLDNTVRCWGGNGSGQLGDGTTESRQAPGEVAW